MEYGAKFTGCTVHFVDDGIDTGPIIMQGLVSIDQEDDEDSLISKINSKEHEILPKSIELLSLNKFIIEGRKVFLKD